eukprot:928757-Rhodomonas_salina.5
MQSDGLEPVPPPLGACSGSMAVTWDSREALSLELAAASPRAPGRSVGSCQCHGIKTRSPGPDPEAAEA